MKKILIIMLLIVVTGTIGFASPQIGDKIDDVLYTDIVTEINGQEVESFNINGSTAIYVTQATKLGYDVIWNGDKRLVTVKNNPSKNPLYKEVEVSQESALDYAIGDKINDVLYTDIMTEINGKSVESFNINGSTAIYVSALRDTGASVEWQGDTRRVIISNVSNSQSEAIIKNRIASFNALHLGWDNGKDYEALANIVNQFDLVALQEVMSEEGIIELTNSLNTVSDKNWAYHLSNKKVGRSTYKEYYGYVYNENVEFLESEGFFPDTNDLYERDPYAATFKINDFDFTFVSLHSIFGDSKSERQFEASYLDNVYYHYQLMDTMENDVFVGGDFNLAADDYHFDLKKMDGMAYVLNPVQKTTIGYSSLSSAYDNIFYSEYTKPVILGTGVYDFTNDRFKEVRESISDHLPVYLEINTSKDLDALEVNLDEPSDEIIPIEENETEESVDITEDNEVNETYNIEISDIDKGGEVVTIVNHSSEAINMTGWKLVSVKGNQVFEFPAGYLIEEGQTIQVVSGRKTEGNGDTILKWTGAYIWNNEDPDPGQLIDDNGKVISTY